MPKFKISRVYCERLEWTVESDNEAEAKQILDDGDMHTDDAERVWLGPFYGLSVCEVADDVCEIQKKENDA